MTQGPSAPQTGERRPMLDRLPVAERDRLILIGRQARGLFGRLDVQHVFDAHLDMFEFLVRSGATASVIGMLLSEVGITRKDGSALPSGTISSALSRARERASRSLAAPLADPQHPAIHGKALHRDAPPGTGLQIHAGTGMAMPRSAEPAPAAAPAIRSIGVPPPRPSDLPAQPTLLSPETRRSAALLARLRNDEN
jgi:hypothetical protein